MSKIKDICQSIVSYGNMYSSSVAKALEEYRKERKAIKQESERYKAQDEWFAEQQKAAAAKARESIEKAAQSFRGNINYALDNYRDALKDSLTYRINPDFISNLKLYNDFNVPMSRLECEMLVNLANGNPAALGALNSVLEKGKSSFRVSFSGVSDYDNQIRTLERLSVKCDYVPADYSSEGTEIFRDTPISYVREDLSTYQTGKNIDSISLMLDRAEFENAMNAVQSTIASFDDKKPQITIVSAENQAAENNALNMAKQAGISQAEADNQAREGLNYYAK